MNVLAESYKYCKRYTPAWISVILCGFVSCAAALLLPQAPQLLIDRIINPALGATPVKSTNNVFSPLLNGFADNDYWGMFFVVMAVLLTLLVIRYSTHYVRWNISHAYGVKAEKNMRQAAYAKLLSQNSVVLNRYTSGDLMCIENSDPIVVKDLYSQNISILMDFVFMLVFSVFFLARIDWYLMIIPLIVGVGSVILTFSYVKALRVCYNNIRERNIELNSCIQENINGVRIIRSYATEDIEVNKFDKTNKAYRDSFVTQAKIVSRYQMIYNFFGQVVNIGSIILGVILASSGSMSLGEFATFITYVQTACSQFINISNYVGVIQNAFICGNRMMTFINTSNIIEDIADAKDVTDKPSISLNNVSVQLDDNEQIIEVSLDIPYGRKLGIMGKTGAGKSVLIKTLPRFFEAAQGEVMINGVNIKNLKLEEVRRQFGYVMQDVFLFSNTVDANIALYDINMPKEKIIDAAKYAEADGFINKLSDGYDTVVGEKGLGLSGGQKQRISIARALAKDAPIIMLDDCTSALDLETERKILHNLSTHYADKTLIISSHRASSVENCDEIVFLDGGRIAERGSHQQLMELKGRYYDIYTTQEASRREALS